MADLFYVENNLVYLTSSSTEKTALARVVQGQDEKFMLDFSDSEGKITCEERFALIRWFNMTYVPKLSV